MAIYINGVKVAGRGISGKSPYQIAASEGYTGTEAEFNTQLAAIGEAVAGFDELSRQVDQAKAEIESAVDAADTAVTQALANISAAQTQINNTVNNATTTINNKVSAANTSIDNKVTAAETQIDAKVQEALAQIPDSENLVTKNQISDMATKTWVNSQTDAVEQNYLQAIGTATSGMATQTWVNTQISNATASIVTDIFSASGSAPSNTKLLWIDTTNKVLKYHNGSKWVAVPVAWS